MTDHSELVRHLRKAAANSKRHTFWADAADALEAQAAEIAMWITGFKTDHEIARLRAALERIAAADCREGEQPLIILERMRHIAREATRRS